MVCLKKWTIPFADKSRTESSVVDRSVSLVNTQDARTDVYTSVA